MKFAVKVVMLDLDGTLVDTAPEIAIAANQMLVDLNRLPLDALQIKNYIGDGAQTLTRRCLSAATGLEPDTELFQQAQRLFFTHYANNVADSQPYAGVESGLEVLLKAGYKLACVTNKPAEFTLPLLEKSGLAPYFELVVSGDTLAKKKPDPMQLLHICTEFNVLVTEALMVGDSYVDIQAAMAAGCFVVTVPYGYNQGKPLDESQVDGMIDDLTELVTLLQ
jgi:phosphoglycolate phosphatase